MKNKPILVVGGGISGMTTAIEAAETGYEVILVEKQAYLGGRVTKMKEYFPKLCPPYCGLEINFSRIKRNPGIKFYNSTNIKSISGSEGDFNVTLIKDAEYVNSNCTACNECSKVCDVDRPNEFNYNMDTTKAIYLPHDMAFPYKFNIDESVCKLEKCSKCVDACTYNAIDLKAKPEEFSINAGSIVFATGWRPYNAELIDNLNFNASPNIITNVMMERLAADYGPTKGKILKPSDGEKPESIAFVQCAGSRDENHLPYCSGVCCPASFKQALKIRKRYPECNVKLFYIDLRVSGRYEDLLVKVQEDEKIELIKGKVACIETDSKTNKLILEAEDVMTGIKNKTSVDIAVLATGMTPTLKDSISSEWHSGKLIFDENGFIRQDKLEPGIYSASGTRKPLNVSDSVKDSTSISLKAIQSVL